MRKAAPFDDRYIPEPNSGCWLWEGLVDKNGYGILTHRKKPYRAHRFSWGLHRGEIPSGMCILHRCDTPECVNPDHLFLGTQGDNSRDRERKKRGALGDQAGQNNRSAKLTEEDVQAILADDRAGWIVAKDFGVVRQTIDRIRKGQRWNHFTQGHDRARKKRYDHVGEKNPGAKLTEEAVRTIRADTRPAREIAKEYGVDPDHIYSLKNRRTWKHV